MKVVRRYHVVMFGMIDTNDYDLLLCMSNAFNRFGLSFDSLMINLGELTLIR